VLIRPFIPATVLLLALGMRTALAQPLSPQAPPPSPFSGTRPDPYFPREPLAPNQPGIGQKFPIVNQPPPVPRLGITDEAAEAPVTTPPPIAPAEDVGELTPDALFRPGRIVGKVGDQIILYGDVASMADQALAGQAARVRNAYQKAEYEALREQVIQQFTKQLVETKIRYLEFRRMMAAKAKDKAADAEKEINKNVKKAFDEGLAEMQEKMATATPKQIAELMQRDVVLPRLALLMKEHNLETLAQLDEDLRRYGSSLEKQQAMFREHNLGIQAVREKIGKKPQEVTHSEMTDYYKKHADKYAIPTQVRFEILTILFSRFPDRKSAHKQLEDMGNSVFFGKPFEEVARQFSQEPNAPQGGAYDWTRQGSLASDVVDAAVFSLPVGKLSLILEDDRGYHIVRVKERKEASQVSFLDAQKEIKEILQKEKQEARIKIALESLRKETSAWTIYDEEPNLARRPGAGGEMK
jgi:parvulin-like peptidyl-prolyl isomerase